MEQIKAIYNAGRWIVYCPIHGRDGAVLALDYASVDPTQSRLWTVGGEYICPACYPGIAAEMTIVKKGRVEKVIDKGAQVTARLLARKDNRIYQVVFPEQREQIEAALRDRPKLQRNWDGPHETLEFIQVENVILDEIARQRHVV